MQNGPFFREREKHLKKSNTKSFFFGTQKCAKTCKKRFYAIPPKVIFSFACHRRSSGTSRPSLGAQVLAVFSFISKGKSQFEKCLGKRLEVPDKPSSRRPRPSDSRGAPHGVATLRVRNWNNWKSEVKLSPPSSVQEKKVRDGFESTNLALLSTNEVLLSTNFRLLGINLVLLSTNLVLLSTSEVLLSY